MVDNSGQLPAGLVKPQLAMKMIDETKDTAKRLYGVDLDQDKNKNWDPSLVNIAQGIILPLLPENLRKQKQNSDNLWSNTLVDAGVAATALTVAGFAAAVMTKNPAFASLGSECGLTLLGKGSLVAGTVCGATVGRHYAHQLVTGANEDWGKSAIHGIAAVASVAAIIGARAQVGKFLFNVADENQLLSRMATIPKYSSAQAAVAGEAATGEAVSPTGYVVKVADVARFYADQNYVLTDAVKTFIDNPANAEKIVVNANGLLDTDLAASVKLGFTPAQSAAAAHNLLVGNTTMVGRTFSMLKPSNISIVINSADPLAELNLSSATAQQIGAKNFYSGYTSAFAGIGTYRSITSLDRPIDPKTNQPSSYCDSFLKSNYRSLEDNTATEALGLALMPVLKDGMIAGISFTAGAGKIGRLACLKYPFLPTGMGALGDGASYAAMGRQAAYLSLGSTACNLRNYSTLQYFPISRSIGHILDATHAPIEDHALVEQAPTATHIAQTPVQRNAAQPEAPQTSDASVLPPPSAPSDSELSDQPPGQH